MLNSGIHFYLSNLKDYEMEQLSVTREGKGKE